MTYFLDTSALVKRYLKEPGSDKVRSLFKRRREICVARITVAELCAAIARVCRDGGITADRRDELFTRAQRDMGEMTVVELRPAVLARVPLLVVRWPLRGYDAVQLAAALAVHSVGLSLDFWSADERLLAAARGEGMRATLPA